MARHADVDWNLSEGDKIAKTVPNDVVKMALLMDIRRELKALNRLLACKNFLAIPDILRLIAKNTKKRKKKKCGTR